MALSDTVGGESRQGVTASARELPPLIRDELEATTRRLLVLGLIMVPPALSRASCPSQHVMPAWGIKRTKLEGIRPYGTE